MSNLKIAPGLSLDADYVGGGTFGLLAKKGAGKSYTARVMAEEMWRANVPFVLMDPMGTSWGLRSSSDGRHEGIPVAIFGGEHGDAPLERTSGALMADLVVDEALSMILDLSTLGSRSSERVFAKDFLERLYRRNRELVHILMDEADLFAPQKPQAGDQPLLGVTENIVRRGRNRGIGITLITQRPAVLNKDVLTQVDGICVLRITGPQDRDAVDKWMEGHGDREAAAEVKASLADLENGDCWWWIPELKILKRVHVREALTFDSSPTRKRGESTRQPKGFADVDLAGIQKKMDATIQRAKAEDPRELRKRISELEVKVKTASIEGYNAGKEEGLAKGRSEAQVQVFEVMPDFVPSRLRDLAGLVRPLIEQAGHVGENLKTLMEDVDEVLEEGRKEIEVPPAAPKYTRKEIPAADWVQSAGVPKGVVLRVDDQSDESTLSKGARGLLEVLVRRHPMELTLSQLATFARRSMKSSSLRPQLKELIEGGYAQENAKRYGPTQAGFNMIGVEASEPQTREEVIDAWYEVLPPAARRMLQAVSTQRDIIWWSREDLAQGADISPTSSALGTTIKVLRDAGLLEEADGVFKFTDL